MKVFMDLTQAARHLDHLGHDLERLGETGGVLHAVVSHQLDESGARQVDYIQKELIGHDQPEWPELAESTIERKEREGFGGAGPLERTEELKDSYSHHVVEEPNESSLVLGSTSKVAVDHELGTEHVPPRPILTPTAQKFEEEIAEILGEAVAGVIVRVNDMALIGIPGVGFGDIFE